MYKKVNVFLQTINAITIILLFFSLTAFMLCYTQDDANAEGMYYILNMLLIIYHIRIT